MKTRQLFLLLITLSCLSYAFAQSTADQVGIAIQGIARNIDNTAQTNKPISLKFTFYYKDGADIGIGSPQTKNLTTDDFGVFSTVVDPGISYHHVFTAHEVYLKIEDVTTSIVISDEKLKHVPYAIAASNGVPTGSIMPFIGTVAPAGWHLCNGTPLPSTAVALKALVGPNAPNLQGMFLRGTGTSPVNSQPGPALKGTQSDLAGPHVHPDNIAVSNTSLTPVSTGTVQILAGAAWAGVQTPQGGINKSQDIIQNPVPFNLSISTVIPDHNHPVTGGVQTNGTTETRPVSYGVNYIIKL